MSLIIHSDGASRGNPGHAGAGAVLCDAGGARVADVSRYLGEMTNNQAEYHALRLALERALELGATDVVIRADSELMIKQLRGEYKVKNEGIKPIFRAITAMLAKFSSWTAAHVRREFNKDADLLANKAIDQHFQC